MSPPIRQLYIGRIVSSSADRELSISHNSVLGVDPDGFIRHFEHADTEASKVLLEKAITDWSLTVHQLGEEDGDHGFLMPGFVDTHIHAPQYMNAGTALDKPLMDWLEHYTFKCESRIDADPAGLGTRVYKKLVERMIEAGTTLACVFGTLSVEANLVLARAFQDAGIRGQIGKVAMDLNGIESYIESTADSLARTSEFITKMEAFTAPLEAHRRLVQPVVTPRFVPTCSKELLVGLAEIAKTTGARIQSHMSEAVDQVEWTKSMWDGKPDYEVLDSLNLLTPKTLMAHCTHLDAPTLSLLATRGVSIAHCPWSNIYFSPEKALPLVHALDAGLSVGLGSDISGGYRLGIDDSMRAAVAVSRIRAGKTPIGPNAEKERVVGWKESIYLATLGGAKALGMEATCGNFEVGKGFDGQLIRLGRKGTTIDLFDEDTPFEEALEKWWCNGTPADRVAVWVQGRNLRMVEEEVVH